jgi:methylated-DNA-[protein]-cysteine S-methyltransferase
MEKAFIKTPLGTAAVSGDEQGISAITIGDEAIETPVIPEVLGEAVRQLRAYFDGTLTAFTFGMNLQGTDFQKNVWRKLTEIPYGRTVSYLELARELGDEKAIRAVASANGRNPLWIVIPCHRVIGANGSLTGYAGGLWRKRWLLEHETPPAQLGLF